MVVSASSVVDAPAAEVFEQIADPAHQPAWDGNDNLATAEAGQRVRAVGEVFTTVLTKDGAERENHVVEFEEGRLIAWCPSEVGGTPPGHLWRWELRPLEDGRTEVTHTYDWTRLQDERRLARARRTTTERLMASIEGLARVCARSAPPPAEHDTTDWTVVLDAGCAECGYRLHDPVLTAERLQAAAPRWAEVLARPGAARRPRERVWSPLEYASHASDLVAVLGERVTAMLEQDDPVLSDYDGEAEAVRQEFWRNDPDEVARQIADRTGATVAVLGRVTGADWERTGRRGDGRAFTITTLCRYLLHDVEHHLHDVGG